MIVTLISQEKIETISLPSKKTGRYGIFRTIENGQKQLIVNIEAVENKWVIRENELAEILNEQGKSVGEMILSDGFQIVMLNSRLTHEKFQLVIEPDSPERKQFQKYVVTDNCKINIGRAADNQLIYTNIFTSAHHACLMYQNGVWSITDTQSSNGIFVNNQKVVMKELSYGDVVYIMGLKIVVGNKTISFNNPDNAVQINTVLLKPYKKQTLQPPAKVYTEKSVQERFYRVPRFRRSIIKETIKIDAPPPAQKIEDTPLVLTLGPALTMGMTAVVLGAIAVFNLTTGASTFIQALPTMVMAISMLCGTMLWPLLTKQSDKKKRIQLEDVRTNKYRLYLDNVRGRFYNMTNTQRDIMHENYPSADLCKTISVEKNKKLWERNSSHEDFMELRLGTGDVPLIADIQYPDNHFSMVDDYLVNDLSRLIDEPKVITNAPITCSLLEKKIVGVIGEREEVRNYINNLLMQITALHGYDEVKVALIANDSISENWKAWRWVPHIWSESKEMRFFATTESDVKALSAYLDKELSERLENKSLKSFQQLPHYVLVVADVVMAEKANVFYRLLNNTEAVGFSCIIGASSMREIPKDCSAVIELNKTVATMFDKSNISGQNICFTPEYADVISVEQQIAALANLTLDTGAEQYKLPNMLSFLDMYQVNKIEHLNVLSRWKESNPVKSLQIPVGVGADGEPFYLDLHEKIHGPHGLIAGMTGSGKSEFIITFILSLAVNYHPDEVSFILIDYKGGGLSGAFENEKKGMRLPHLAGTITNLDGAEVKRSLISIQSELRRRQAIFNEARNITGEGTMDIYKYQKLYRNNIVKEPVPHLFIVSDEFAELKMQQPEFMDQLISAARIGRSLGVHLILATQKPAGVVNDQIWSNSRFRVCMKVQEKADSMDMLKRPDAANLTETGRFYLQVGFNEYFALGQSAWSGAPYQPGQNNHNNEIVTVIDDIGRALVDMKPESNFMKSASSQIVAIVQHLSDIAQQEHIPIRQLWLPVIPAVIYLDELRRKYNWCVPKNQLEAVIGEYDDPINQKQGLLTIPFTEAGNTLVYGVAGGGKSTLLNTMLKGLLTDYTSEQLNVYLIDLGEETLQAYKQAPHVGDVILSTDTEKMYNLFKMLEKELLYRKTLFADDDGDYMNYCNRTQEQIPHILVVVRNYAAFLEQFEQLEDKLVRITREGRKCGIYFIMTANSSNAVRYRVMQNFTNILALQLQDKSDYIALFGSTDGIYPSKAKGRGLCKMERTYEFQVAHMAANNEQDEIKELLKQVNQSVTALARKVPVLPDIVTTDYFNAISEEAFPIGIEKETIEDAVVNLNANVITLAAAQNIKDYQAFINGITEQLTKLDDAEVIVFDGAKTMNTGDDQAYQYVYGDYADAVDVLYNTMVHRNNQYKTAKAANQTLPEYSKKYYVITGFQSIYESLSAENQDKLNVLIEKAELEYHIRFILCDTSKNISSYMHLPWYKRHVSDYHGIWLGNGFAEQHIVKVRKMQSTFYAEIPYEYGYMVKDGNAKLIKLLFHDEGNRRDV